MSGSPPPLDVEALRADTPALCSEVLSWIHRPARPPGAPDVAWAGVDDVRASVFDAPDAGGTPPPTDRPADLCLRADAPAGTVTPARTMTPVHLNAAGASLPPAPVLAAVLEWTAAECTVGGYEAAGSAAGLQATDARPKAALAALLNCAPSDVALLPSATHAWNQVFGGVAACLGPGDTVLSVGLGEYGSNAVAMLQASARGGFAVEPFPRSAGAGAAGASSTAGAPGALDLGALCARLARGDVALVCCAHAPTAGGWVVDAAGVGEACAAARSPRGREGGVPFLLDACQTAGQLPLDVATLRCWWLTGTGRKFLRGPRGVGFLYASPSARRSFEPAVLDVRGAEWALADDGSEAYTSRAPASAAAHEFYEGSFAARAGFGVALAYLAALGGPGPTGARAARLASAARAGLAALPRVTVHDGPPGPAPLSAIVTFTVAGLGPQAVARALAAARPRPIFVHASGASSSARSFMPRGLHDGVVRASFHYYNLESEVDALVEAVRSVAAAG